MTSILALGSMSVLDICWRTSVMRSLFAVADCCRCVRTRLKCHVFYSVTKKSKEGSLSIRIKIFSFRKFILMFEC